MKALITGATSGIGRDMAVILSRMGCELIIASRDVRKMEQIKRRLPVPVRIIQADLSREADCYALYEQVKEENIDILINNAGFGAFGQFAEIPLETELNMLDLNVRAVHILTKLFLLDFRKRNSGYILNVASSAGLLPAGPYMATYYATKAYVSSLTQAIAQELKEMDSKVYVGALCPGPVDTEFYDVANVEFTLKGITPEYCVEYAIKQMIKRQTVIVPTLFMKASTTMGRFAPRNLAIKITAGQQKKKLGM